MNIDPVLAQFIITAIVAVPVYFKMRSEWRKATADADSSNVKDSLELKREYKADLAALEVKYEALVVKFDALQSERVKDKAFYEAEIDQLRQEVRVEREARQREREEFQAQLDERDAVIVSLQGQLDKLQSRQSNSHGFK